MKSITIWGEEGEENSHINEIVNGRKKAFCSPEVWFGQTEEEPETRKGEQLILKDPSGKNRVLIEVTEIRVLKFGDADEAMARDVLDCDLQDFRDAHRFYWEEDLKVSDELPIVVEYFKIIEVY
ncbi:MAG: ASCH domain-containing protein [Spirochaetaceae bacterium]|nr:ASCH domain-containing protein [Spirochaetaceae bacterium]